MSDVSVKVIKKDGVLEEVWVPVGLRLLPKRVVNPPYL
jgi:hypothetical protein